MYEVLSSDLHDAYVNTTNSSYVADMSPECALAIALTTSRTQIPVMRDFLERYVSGRVFFGVSMVCIIPGVLSPRTANLFSLPVSGLPWNSTYLTTLYAEAQ